MDGLPLNEFRVLAEKATTNPEYRDEKNRRVEFVVPTFNVLNALEQMGYKVMIFVGFLGRLHDFCTSGFGYVGIFL